MSEIDDEMPKQPTHYAWRKYGQWISACLSYGWKKDSLDALGRLWWKYHDNYGNESKEERTMPYP